MGMREGMWWWPFGAFVRLRSAVRTYWKRMLVGAFVGWLFAVIGGAVALAWLEVQGVMSRTTADDLGIMLVLYCVGLGALNAYVFRPPAAEKSGA